MPLGGGSLSVLGSTLFFYAHVREGISVANNQKQEPGCFAKLVAAVVMAVGLIWVFHHLSAGCTLSPDSDTRKSSEYVPLKGAVETNGDGTITLTNRDSFDWSDVELTINFKVLGGYKLKTSVIAAGQSFTANVREFTEDDGTRFNPLATKILNVNVTCTTKSGRGLYVAESH
jgi:hypothetical protein